MSTIVHRFWKYVDRQEGACWLWTGATRNGGYGQISDGRGVVKAAHRVAYEIHHGPVPDGMMVLHSCDTPACVNPAHLRLGTHRENMEDAVRRRRFARAPRVRGRRLPHGWSWKDVLRIRRLQRDGWSLRRIAPLFTVSHERIRQVLAGSR